jgi:hypothetical protein
MDEKKTQAQRNTERKQRRMREVPFKKSSTTSSSTSLKVI